MKITFLGQAGLDGAASAAGNNGHKPTIDPVEQLRLQCKDCWSLLEEAKMAQKFILS